MKHQTVLMCISLMILLIRPSASTAGSYGTELPFVLGTGARVSGMGAAGTSLRGNASIHFYNPAALSYLEQKQFTFFRTTLFDSESVYHTASYAHPLMNVGTIGLSILRVDVDGIEERNNINELLSNDMHNSQTRILLGFARQMSSMISAGVNLKVDNQKFGDLSATGVGLDVGATASQSLDGSSFVKELRQGFVIQNVIEPSLTLDQEDVPDPRSFVLGVSALSEAGDVVMVTAIDIVRARFSPARFRIGQEVSYMDLFSLRFGVDDKDPTYGFGAKWKHIAVDYAYLDEDLGNNHRVSLSVRFGSARGAPTEPPPFELWGRP